MRANRPSLFDFNHAERKRLWLCLSTRFTTTQGTYSIYFVLLIVAKIDTVVFSLKKGLSINFNAMCEVAWI